MSKTIEFVEQATIANQRRLEQYKKDLEYYKKESGLINFRDVGLINYGAKIFQLEHDIEHIEKIVLPNLQQIKCELEAWEEVKKDKGVCEKQEFWGKDCKKVIQISCRIFPEGTEQYEKLKKALEVEDESTIKNK